MIVKTSGLTGTLIAFAASGEYATQRDGLDGVAILKREGAPFADAPYSTHLLHTDPDGNQYATGGHYDLTRDQARADFAQRSAI